MADNIAVLLFQGEFPVSIFIIYTMTQVKNIL